MIANLQQNGWEVIYHRAHALLAAQLAGHWEQKKRPLRWLETIAAISHHDDLEKEWEGNHLTEAGAPLDFTLIKEVTVKSVEGLRKLARDSQYRGRWVAMLISMHISFLNEDNRGQLPELDSFLDEQLQHQEQWRKELNITKDEAAQAYAFFQWCDRFSLILCNHTIPPDQRALEIAPGPDGNTYDVIENGDGNVTVKPWPFTEEKFSVNVEACYLHQLKFDSNAELTEALRNAPIKTLEWTFVKS
jgi:hypothetical protein